MLREQTAGFLLLEMAIFEGTKKCNGALLLDILWVSAEMDINNCWQNQENVRQLVSAMI